ncbi:MAG: septum formation initiator family protein [Parvibaculum sp.]|uniref:FtsB family cell division protein n=1 Tax=Parvibaculum sp. TaxID=2024848 RepID=UPI0032EAFBF6
MTLLGFQGYLGYSAISGQFGIENREDILADIEILQDRSAALQAEIDAYRHRVSLMNPRHLDPDIVTERARALLNMAHADDILVMVNPETGQPISGQFVELIDDELISIIQADSTL